MKKSEIPVEALYVLAFLVLMSLAGTSLYYYMEGQSTARNYRMSAALILEESESLKLMIDQERQFVLETVIFFLGSQGGVSNIAEYNEYNLTLIENQTLSEDYSCITTMKSMAGGVYPSPEVLSRCIKNPNNYNYPESIGAWKCDDKIYSYAICESNDGVISPSLCCKDKINNKTCHEGCLLALGFDTSYCSGKTYCGALYCQENYLEIPESYQGVQYYYKIGEQSPGYSCESLLSFNPELTYPEQDLWEGADSSYIINSLVKLSNEYFYMPHPKFTSYIRRVYNKDLKLTFQLKYKGCNNKFCEFAWVPYGDYQQGFTAYGIGGIPMMTVSNEILSLQTLEIPILDMSDYSRRIIENKEMANYFSKILKNETLINEDNLGYTQHESIKLADWKNITSRRFGIDIQPKIIQNNRIYDDSNCGQEPYEGIKNYDCLMQHASSKIYESISQPMLIMSQEKYYNLRPVFNFVKTSLGESINITGNGNYDATISPGKYAIFVQTEQASNGKINILGNEYEFNFPQNSYSQIKRQDDTVGVCLYNNYEPSRPFNYYEKFGCCPLNHYNISTKQCNSEVLENDYCQLVNNGYGRSQIGAPCFLSNAGGGMINYDVTLFEISGITPVEILSGNIESIDFIRVEFSNTFNTFQRTIKGIEMNFGGLYEYYDSTTNCRDPTGPVSSNYNYESFEEDKESWYSMLCLRSLGKSWTTIIENYTGIYKKFNSTIGQIDKLKIDAFIGNYKIEIEEFPNYYLVKYNNTECPAQGCSIQLKSNPQLLWISTINEPFNALSGNELILERLREIQTKSTYLPLPVKWIFGYRDKVSFNQTNPEIGGDHGCELRYDLTKKPAPDCGCISDCSMQKLCIFNFSKIEVNNLMGELVDFENIFIHNSNYKNTGVVGR